MARKKKVTPSTLNRTCGPGCPVDPPNPWRSWEDFLAFSKDPPKPYRSWLEFRLFTYKGLKGCDYEPATFSYTVQMNKKYTPDSVIGKFLIEVKGRFRTQEEKRKYLFIRDSNPDKELVFILAKPGVKVFGAKKRRDGTYFTMEEWCREHGFRYCFEAYAEELIEQLKFEATL